MSASNSQQTSEKRFAHLYTIKVDCRKQCPIVYADEYNISFFGVERLHPFDSKKWGRVHRFLIGFILFLIFGQKKNPRKWNTRQDSFDQTKRSWKKRFALCAH